jgi:hypothetical protein
MNHQLQDIPPPHPPYGRRGRPPLELTPEERNERRREQRKQSYYKKKSEPKPLQEPISAARSANDRPGSLCPESEGGSVYWVASITPDNYSVASRQSIQEIERSRALSRSIIPYQPPHYISPYQPHNLLPTSAQSVSSFVESALSQNLQQLDITRPGPRTQVLETADAVAEELSHPTFLQDWLQSFDFDDHIQPQNLPQSQAYEAATASYHDSVSLAADPLTARPVAPSGQLSNFSRIPPSIEEAELRTLNEGMSDEVLQHRHSASRYIHSQLCRTSLIHSPEQPLDGTDFGNLLSLAQVSQKIQDLAIPDILGQNSMLPLSSTIDKDWQQLLSGGDNNRTLEFRKSHNPKVATEVTWDVDSFIARLNCLSACRGIRFSLYPKASWNFKGDLHVKISDCTLHETAHVRLGSILDAESYSLFAVFPNLSRGSRKKTYLRAEEHRAWVDELPSIYEHCPFNVTHHFPRSW